VRDDGGGFDSDAQHDGMGLRNLRDRLGAFDRHLEIISPPGGGTLVAGAVPIAAAAPERV
jgi:signal transduction histidine kinase